MLPRKRKIIPRNLYRGYILISLLIITSAFPPIFGYSIYLTLSGYSFGFSAGFPIAYFSALGGASACFWLSRTIFKQKVIRILARYPSMQAVIRAVEKKGFKVRGEGGIVSKGLTYSYSYSP